MESKTITIIVEKGENDYFVGQIKEYPAAISQGKTIEELMDNLKDALSLLFDEPMELSRELTAKEEKEAFLYTSKMNAAKTFGDKI